MNAVPALPVAPSVSDFRDRRQNYLLYVDKTAQIASFLTHDRALLFTRPRRFGKSLLLSTIEAMYGGDRELFGGDARRPELSVYRKGAWHWRSHPVLRLDMLTVRDRGYGIAPALSRLVARTATQLQMAGQYGYGPPDPVNSLADLIVALSQKSEAATGQSRVVILVDEYDAPILNHMHEPRAREVRQELADFYGVFKSLSSQIEVLVMTGVTRFVKTGLWSKLNQVRDQSENPRFHDLIGFTDHELDTLWAQVQDQISVPPPREGWPPLSREAWQEWYNGYRFSPRAPQPLYNPFAIMSSLADGEMGEY